MTAVIVPTWVRVLALALLTVPAAVGCIPHRPHRTFDYQDVTASGIRGCQTVTLPVDDACSGLRPGALCTSIDELTSTDSLSRTLARCTADEFHRPQPKGKYPHNGFDLHTVEFDDEGQPWNAREQDRALESIRSSLAARPALLVAFVHGWKHDAAVCDGNLTCFRDMLEVLAKLQYAVSGSSSRRVIGVYVGWRGGSLRTPAKQLTFWGRKHTAHAIGDNGAVTAFVRRLREIVSDRRRQNPTVAAESPQETSMVLIGHSFGAALLYSALGTSINAEAGAALEDALRATGGADSGSPRVMAAERPERRRVPGQPLAGQSLRPVRVLSQGDLVVLVNPAMEASRFSNLAAATQLRYDPAQTPILLSLASEADGAVKYAFPFGQSLSTLLRSARSRAAWFSMVEGFGMLQPFTTHRLLPSSRSVPDVPRQAAPCQCASGLRAHGDELVERLKPYLEFAYRGVRIESSSGRRNAAVRIPPLAAYQEFLYSRLEPQRDVDPNSPFLMVQVDRSIVRGHTDIFNPRFVDFLIEFTTRSELKRRLNREELRSSLDQNGAGNAR